MFLISIGACKYHTNIRGKLGVTALKSRLGLKAATWMSGGRTYFTHRHAHPKYLTYLNLKYFVPVDRYTSLAANRRKELSKRDLHLF